MEWRRSEYLISTDPERLDLDVIHRFLSGESYWAPGVTREVVERSIENSICFGLYEASGQAGFARVITDRAAFAYLADVFVLPDHRGRGLGKWLSRRCCRTPTSRTFAGSSSGPRTPTPFTSGTASGRSTRRG
jgi:GNAT superfamily N-acetyltransferase